MESPVGNLGGQGVREVEIASINQGVEQDMIGKGAEVEALETHSSEQVEGVLGAACDGIAEDEGVVETGASVGAGGVPQSGGGEVVEPVEDGIGEAGAGKDAEDGVVGREGVAVGGVPLLGRPVEELEAE